ncbi:LemA protein [Azospirillaceae bacterium]|nr:magnetosome protein MamQ [uncultured bacterium]
MAKTSFEQTADGNTGDQMHRIRRSEVLLAELYGLTPKPQYRVRKVRGIRTMMVVSLVTIAAAVSVVYYKINHFIMLLESAQSRESNLDAAVQRRTNLFANVVKLTLSHAELEHVVFSRVAEMRTEIIKQSKLPDAVAGAIAKETARAPAVPGRPGDGAGINWDSILKSLATEGGAEASFGHLLAMVEQYPNIKSSETYLQAIKSLTEMEDRIADRRAELNESLREYNTAVTSFPWQYLASVSGFKWKDYSRAGNGQIPAKDITTELYQQLIPLGRHGEGPK